MSGGDRSGERPEDRYLNRSFLSSIAYEAGLASAARFTNIAWSRTWMRFSALTGFSLDREAADRLAAACRPS